MEKKKEKKRKEFMTKWTSGTSGRLGIIECHNNFESK